MNTVICLRVPFTSIAMMNVMYCFSPRAIGSSSPLWLDYAPSRVYSVTPITCYYWQASHRKAQSFSISMYCPVRASQAADLNGQLDQFEYHRALVQDIRPMTAHDRDGLDPLFESSICRKLCIQQILREVRDYQNMLYLLGEE